MSQTRPPSVEVIVSHAGLGGLIGLLGRPIVTEHVRRTLEDLRRSIPAGEPWPTVEEIIARVKQYVAAHTRRFPQRVINATGVLLHTNLGRAPWGQYLLDQVGERLTSYLSLEYDLAKGERGKRGVAVEEELAALAEAETALVVNNNAGAVYLALTALAWDREVVISRGELVQIGGGFRIPEILAKSGAVLREIGTTNQTNLADYEKVCGPQTALILKVHRSNFEQTGFVGEVEPKVLARLGKERGIPVLWDLGSGAVGPGSICQYSGEPTVKAAVATGADLVTCSGDKLLGGPQAGIILGRRDLIDRLRSDPFYRSLRPGKSTLLVLEATVAAHRAGRAETLIPLYQLLAVSTDDLRARAERITAVATDAGWDATVIPAHDTFGGGAAPGKTIDGWGVRLAAPAPDDVVRAARAHTPPILGTISDDAVVFSLRTMFASDDTLLSEFLRGYPQAT